MSQKKRAMVWIGESSSSSSSDLNGGKKEELISNGHAAKQSLFLLEGSASKKKARASSVEDSPMENDDDTHKVDSESIIQQHHSSKVSSASKKRAATGGTVNSSSAMNGAGHGRGQERVSARLKANSASSNNENEESVDEVVTKYTKLPSIPAAYTSKPKRLARLTRDQVEELQGVLQLNEEGWREDWMGNLALITEEVPNPTSNNKVPGAATLPFWEWSTASTVGPRCMRLLRNLFFHVHHMEGTPPMARQILAYAIATVTDIINSKDNFKQSVLELISLVKSLFHHPVVLQQDGWTTKPTSAEQHASGGPVHIGTHVIWQKFEAVVIAFVHDADIGDLWKCMWLEEFDTFDLEAEELFAAQKKYQRKQQSEESSKAKKSKTTSFRFADASNYMVEGIEDGIVMAGTYHPHARHGVLWPARIMHISEITAANPLQPKQRSSSRNKVRVVFLAPYWNGRSSSTFGRTGGGVTSLMESYSGDGTGSSSSLFSSGPLLELDTVEVSKDLVQKYPYNELNIHQLRIAFKFSGLPKAAFSRFLDSHRLAMALKTYARYLRSTASTSEPTSKTSQEDTKAMSTLTDTHAMSIMAPIFPSAVLHLPWDYILSNLPNQQNGENQMDDDEAVEPALQLDSMLEAMKPPRCWGQQDNNDVASSPARRRARKTSLPSPSPMITSPPSMLSNGESRINMDDSLWSLNNCVSEYLLKEMVDEGGKDGLRLSRLGNDLNLLLSRIQRQLPEIDRYGSERRTQEFRSIVDLCFMTKSHGEDVICTHYNRKPVGDPFNDPTNDNNCRKLLTEWRKACERIYKRALIRFSSMGFGNGVTLVVTDSRCNEHITPSGCVERPVRLPATLKGVKMVGLGQHLQFARGNPAYFEKAEQSVLPKAHSLSYLKRMKSRCVGLAPDAKGVPLTDGSDGRGGEDTMGSRGTYTAAVAGVAAALRAVDFVVGGECVNAFCATRPPGHHAGRDLHAMKAVSNGFCVLNPAACAAIYATTPQSEGGPGLRRVCVIDFDVHHGNGTQDILCSTYDPRFFYVSLHAGGAHINGYEREHGDDIGGGEASSFIPGGSTPQKNGIFPGRCGDTNPHKGVLNIPLGARVTAHDVGTAIVTIVNPAVDTFAPDLIILSAGFDAHKNDPLGMGGLSAQDFGSITEVACSMASRSCSGRVVSILEGGYGIPCCRPQADLFLPKTGMNENGEITLVPLPQAPPQQQPRLMDIEDQPEDMDDQLPPGLRRKVDKCHEEGFVECVCQHVRSLTNGNTGGKA